MDELLATLAHEVGAAAGRLWVRLDRPARVELIDYLVRDSAALAAAHDHLDYVINRPASYSRRPFEIVIRWHIIRMRAIQ